MTERTCTLASIDEIAPTVHQTVWANKSSPEPISERDIDWNEYVNWVLEISNWPVVADKLQLQLASFARFTGRRCKANFQDTSALGLDFDHDPDVERVREQVKPFDFLIHSTHSHTRDAPRFRLFIRLNRPVTGAEYPKVWRAAARLAGGSPDESAKDCSRGFFVPALHPDRKNDAFAYEGEGDEFGIRAPLDVEWLLREYGQAEDEPFPSADGAARPVAVNANANLRKYTDISPPTSHSNVDIERVRSALAAIPPDERAVWFKVTAALKHLDREDEFLELWDQWSRGELTSGRSGPPETYDKAENLRQWTSLGRKTSDVVGIGTLFHIAYQHGWNNGTTALSAVGALNQPSATTGYLPSNDPLPDQAPANDHQSLLPPADHRRFPLIWFDDIKPEVSSRAIVKGLLAEGAYSVVYGEPGCGKTFIVLDLAVHVAAGIPWMGKRTRQCAVVYVAAEGGSQVLDRVAAFKLKHAGVLPSGRIPFAAITAQVNLLNPDADLPYLILRIREAEAESRVPIGLIIIDTLSRTLAGGDENSSEDMGAFIRNTDQLRLDTGAHVLVIHHSGKNRLAGARGHSSLRAATDTEIEVEADANTGIRRMLTKKQRDLPTEGEYAFRLLSVPLGTDEDGDAVSSCVVEPCVGQTPAAGQHRRKVPAAAQRSLDILKDAIARQPEPPPASEEIPQDAQGIREDVWRERCYAAQIGDTPDAQRRAFSRAGKALLDGGHIGKWGGFVWLVR